MQNEHPESGSIADTSGRDSTPAPDRAGSTPPGALADYERIVAKDAPGSSYHYQLDLARNQDFAQNMGQNATTYLATLQEMFRTVENGKPKDFSTKHGELFLKEHDGLVSDTNAKLVFHHVPDMQSGKDVKLIQDLAVGLNVNWRDEIIQANLAQAFNNGQNANLAVTSNRNGCLIYTGATWAPPNYKDEHGNEVRYTGDFQVEVPHDNEGISKIEIKGGRSGEFPRDAHGNFGDNGYMYRFVAGPAFRSDGVSGLLDGSLRFNETSTFIPVDGIREVEKRSCEFNLTCIIPEHGANYRPEFKAGVGLERERTHYVAEEQELKILDRLRMEFLSDGDSRHRLDLNYGRVWEQGRDGSRKELNIRGFCEQDQGVLNYGAYLEYRFKWGATSQHKTEGAKDHAQGPFGNPELDRYHGSVRDGNSAMADRLANEFAQSAEGQRMAQQGDRLFAQQQAQESALAEAQVQKGPAMRI